MKKYVLVTIITILIFTPLVALHAEGINDARSTLQNTIGPIFGGENSSVSVIIGRVIQVILGVVGLIFLILTVYGGFMYMTAAGNEDQVKRARTLIRDAAIGVGIVITSFAITEFVIGGLLDATGL